MSRLSADDSGFPVPNTGADGKPIHDDDFFDALSRLDEAWWTKNPDAFLKLARHGKTTWNRWRDENPAIAVAFAGVNFSKKENADIDFTDFRFGDDARFHACEFGDGPIPAGPNEEPTAFKPGMARFTGAIFGDRADFSGATFGTWTVFSGEPYGDKAAIFGNQADFSRAIFGGAADFSGVIFGDEANFSGVIFYPQANLSHAKFGNAAAFRCTHFANYPNLSDSTFGDDANFSGAFFANKAFFGDATFGASSNFRGATFEEWTSFGGATFLDWADFSGTTFGDCARLSGTTFGAGARFSSATFVNRVSFFGATFGGDVHFDVMSEEDRREFCEDLSERMSTYRPATWQDEFLESRVTLRPDSEGPGRFKIISFSGARFAGTAKFAGRKFEGPCEFITAIFKKLPDFNGCDGVNRINFYGAEIGSPDNSKFDSKSRMSFSIRNGLKIRRGLTTPRNLKTHKNP